MLGSVFKLVINIHDGMLTTCSCIGIEEEIEIVFFVL